MTPAEQVMDLNAADGDSAIAALLRSHPGYVGAFEDTEPDAAVPAVTSLVEVLTSSCEATPMGMERQA